MSLCGRHGPMVAALLIIAVCFATLSDARKAGKPEYSRLCPKKIRTEQHWRECAYRTISEWHKEVVDTRITNVTIAQGFFEGILDPNVTIRLDPIGLFAGMAKVSEYLALFTSPTGPAEIIRPLSFNIRRYAAVRPVVVATVDILFINVFTNKTANLTTEEWFRFNDYNRVVLGDFTVDHYPEMSIALQVDTVLSAMPQVASMIHDTVCGTASALCNTPALQQYADSAACFGFLSSLPLSNPLRTQSNTVICRFLHAELVKYAPEIHCPHIGPTGGGACVDVTYEQYYTDSPFAAESFIPPTYRQITSMANEGTD